MADTTTTTTNNNNNLNEDEEKELYEDDENEEIFESFKSLRSEMDKLKEKGSDETNYLKSLFKDINGVKAAVTSAHAHAVEGSERSDELRAMWEKLNECLYWSAATSTGAGCFIKEGLMKLVLINEEEEEEECCAICLEGMNKSGDVVGWIEHCDHSFHFVCLNQWMKRKHTCPICRLEMDDDQLLINGDILQLAI